LMAETQDCPLRLEGRITKIDFDDVAARHRSGLPAGRDMRSDNPPGRRSSPLPNVGHQRLGGRRRRSPDTSILRGLSQRQCRVEPRRDIAARYDDVPLACREPSTLQASPSQPFGGTISRKHSPVFSVSFPSLKMGRSIRRSRIPGILERLPGMCLGFDT